MLMLFSTILQHAVVGAVPLTPISEVNIFASGLAVPLTLKTINRPVASAKI